MLNFTTVRWALWIYCNKLISPYIPNLYDVFLIKTTAIPSTYSSKLMNFNIILTKNVRVLTILVLVIIHYTNRVFEVQSISCCILIKLLVISSSWIHNIFYQKNEKFCWNRRHLYEKTPHITKGCLPNNQ